MDEEKTPLLLPGTSSRKSSSNSKENSGSSSETPSIKLQSIGIPFYGTESGSRSRAVPSGERITYTWNNINAFASSNERTRRKYLCCGEKITAGESQKKHILKNVIGAAYPGELLAVLGSSGSGKTTLLNALTFRPSKDVVVTGTRCVNGVPINSGSLTSISAYVQQDDLFIACMTVKEHLIFQALVRMDTLISYEQRMRRVEEVLSEMALKKCENTAIGGVGMAGISGGEKKRLSFAAEVLTNPSLMFCDEPTSGLDSFMALNVVQVLKTMAQSGKTVVCTIHQPSSELYAMFDKILLMTEGRVAFQGSPEEADIFFRGEDNIRKCIQWSPYSNIFETPFSQKSITSKWIIMHSSSMSCLTNLVASITLLLLSFILNKYSIGYLYNILSTNSKIVLNMRLEAPCPRNYNPADYFIQLLAIVPGREESCRQAVSMICSKFQRSEPGVKLTVDSSTMTENVETTDFEIWLNGDSISPYKASWCAQFRAVLWRSWLATMKDPLLVKVRLLQTTMVALIIGAIYYGQELNQDGVMNINGVLFIFLTNMTFQNVFAVIHVFCSEIPLFLREHRNGMYRTDVYFLSKTVAELPFFIILPTLFTSVCYFLIGLNPEISRFFIACGIVVLVANVATSFGYMISCVSNSNSMALSLGPPLIIPFLLFGGFFLNVQSIPIYFKWLSYLSWFKYGNEALMINQWENITQIDCPVGNSTCPRDGHVVLQIYNFFEENMPMDLISLFALIVGFRLVAYLGLLNKTY